MVLLAPRAVARQVTARGDTAEALFGGRAKENPQIWSAIPVQTAALVRALEDEVGGEALVAFGGRVHGFAAELTAAQVEALRADPRVEAVFPDPKGETAGSVPDWYNLPGFGPGYTYTNGYNLYAIDAIQGAGKPPATPLYRTDGGYPVRAYVIDSGVQMHDDLNFAWKDQIRFDCHENIGGNGCVAGEEPVYGYHDPCDSHATHVAGIVGARRQGTPLGVEGVAPGASIVSVKVINYCVAQTGSQTYPGIAYLSGVVAAIQWIEAQIPADPYKLAVDSKGRRRLTAVANMSILWNNVDPSSPHYIPAAGQAALSSAVAAAVDKGVFFSFAAGNNNYDACSIHPAKIGAQVKGAMTVGALANSGVPMRDVPGDPGKRAAYGPCVEIWAPGQSVQSTGTFPGVAPENGIPENVPYPVWGPWVPVPATTSNLYPGQSYYLEMSGSSMAAPHVAGAALLLAKRRGANNLPSPAEIEEMLLAKTKTLPAPKDKYGGYPQMIAPLPVKILTVDQF